MSNKFLKIDNTFLTDEKMNIFTEVGTEGFLLYTYFLYEQGNSSSVNITIKGIQSFLNREFDERSLIEYDNKKTCKVSLLKDKRTIVYYINRLIETNYIILHNKNDIEKLGLNTILIISVNEKEYEKGFTIIPCDVFLNYIHKIGHIGWAILCLLSKLHNIEYGNTEDGGFANPSEDYISRVVKTGLTSIKAYLKLLEKRKLLKIQPQQPIVIGQNQYGEEIYEYTPNHYTVRWKIYGDKNYMPMPVKKESEKKD